MLAPEPFLEITDRVGEARIATARILRDAGVEVPRPPPRADAPTRTLDEMLEDADADEDFAAAWARASKRAASRPPKPPKPPRSKGEEPKDDGFDPDRDPIECYFNARARRVNVMNRGDAAAATWIFRGDGRRRGNFEAGSGTRTASRPVGCGRRPRGRH